VVTGQLQVVTGRTFGCISNTHDPPFWHMFEL